MRAFLLCSFSVMLSQSVWAVTPEDRLQLDLGHDPEGSVTPVTLDGGTAGVDPCPAEQLGFIDSAFSFPNRLRGNWLEITNGDATLRRFGMELDYFGTQTDLTFWVMVRNEEGLFTPIHSETSPTIGIGQTFYWSDEFEPAITLLEGHEYVLAVSWGNVPLTYGRDSQTYPQDFAGGIVKGSVGATMPIPNPVQFSLFSGGVYSMKICIDPRPGACCNPTTRSCVPNLFEQECVEEIGGFFQGQNTTCGAAPCIFGACCRLTGECLNGYTIDACAEIPGIFHEGDECIDVNCLVLAGACCLGEECFPDLTESSCNLFGGLFRGAGSKCETVDPPCGRGACCSTTFGCFETTPVNCAGAGVFLDFHTRCIDSAFLCDGSCCAGDNHGACVPGTRNAEECSEFPNGVYLGFTSCSAVVCGSADEGTCCLPTGGCVVTTHNGCDDIYGVFQGGASCPATGTCAPVGACCRGNGACTEMTVAGCALDGGVYGGNGSICPEGPCGTDVAGACCPPGGGDCLIRTLAQCTGLGGVYQGAGTACTPGLCGPPIGGCCFGNGTCGLRSQANCITEGGTWQGAGTDCTPNNCPQPSFACCHGVGLCSVVTQAACNVLGGEFKSGIDNCEEADCPLPPAACCFTNGTCQTLTPQQCATGNGTYQGVGSTCTPNSCPQPASGACCLAAGGCQVLSPTACGLGNGVYRGDNTICTPDPCTVISIVSSVPPNNSIDARQPSALVGGCVDTPGYTSIDITFSGSTASVVAGDFVVSLEPAGGTPPSIINVAPSGSTVTLTLNGRIPVGKWTRFTHSPSASSTRIGYLPADVNNDRTASPVDILKLIDHLNLVESFQVYQTDIDRSNVTNPADILRVIDLLNGADCYDVYNGQMLPP